MFRRSSRFFIDSDFEAFNHKLAESEATHVIANRKYVVDNRLKVLHFDADSGNGLRDFFGSRGLHPHWQLIHLTNVYWPYPVANGGWVDYLRMGYGKEKVLVQDLAKRSGVFTEITNFGERDAVAFYCVTQLQVGINEDGWWVNLYIDKKGWIEQYNLLDKIKDPKLEREFVDLLDAITAESYEFFIYPFPYADTKRCADSMEFIEQMRSLRANKNHCSICIEKFHKRDDRNNNIKILDYLKGEFTKLLPLYRFISWHPRANHHLKGL